VKSNSRQRSRRIAVQEPKQAHFSRVEADQPWYFGTRVLQLQTRQRRCGRAPAEKLA